jgi:hypothetical protein
MSTLKVNTLTDTAATKSVPIEDVVNGVARAWVNFNGTGTVAIRADYNVTDITDNGTGDYTVNFTNAMPDANYVNVFGSYANNGEGVGHIAESSATAKSTTALRINIQTGGGVLLDRTVVSVAVFR